MTILFIILIILASVVLSFIVLVQNPKGGGLAGNIAGFSNQFMGVKQTTDVLEKGTWVFAAVIGILCMVSVMFIPKGSVAGTGTDASKGTNLPLPAQKPAANPPGTMTLPVAPGSTPAATPGTTPATTPK
jgi:preprotein translocase subunit SecG